MKETILITGGTGLVGRRLAALLAKDYNLRYLSRTPAGSNQFAWDISTGFLDPNALKEVDHIIHLAGENILKKRWTEDRKIALIESRVYSTKLLYTALEKAGRTIKTFISASAVGYYGAVTQQQAFSEEDPAGTDFAAELCMLWEKAADLFEDPTRCQRVVKLRTAVVLSAEGGALAPLSLPIKLGLGSPLGKGTQYMPWIHIDDLCSLYKYALTNTDVAGVYNASAPEQCTNAQITATIAKYLNRPLWLPNVPAAALKLALGEAADMLLEGSPVSTEKIQAQGYKFHYPALDAALKQLLKKEE